MSRDQGWEEPPLIGVRVVILAAVICAPQADGAWPFLAVKCECPSLDSLMGKMVPTDHLSLGGY